MCGIALMLFTFYRCSDDVADNRDILNRKLAQDKDLRLLIAIRDEYIGRIIKNNISPEELQKACEEDDEQKILALLSYSAEEAEEFSRCLRAASERIKNRYPSLEKSLMKNPCAKCEQDISGFFRNFDKYSKQGRSPRLKNGLEEQSDCLDRTGYTACLLNCPSSFPYYGLCAVNCHNSYCL
jgi:hypothetical protein